MTGAPPMMPDCQKPLPGAPVIGFSDLLGARPPSLLPDGKPNPEYHRWYRRAKPEKYRTQHNKDMAIRTKKKHEHHGTAFPEECKCVECKIVFKRLDAHARGFRFLGRYNCICDECA